MRVVSYVDGFNLYYTALRDTPYKWLDLQALASRFVVDGDCLEAVNYFTAKVHARRDPAQPQRQQIYLRALWSHIENLSIHFGHFKVNEHYKAKLNPPIGVHQFATVIKTEEKGSDVNLAVHLLNDAWADRFDIALVFSNDSDLQEAIDLTRKLGKIVRVVIPRSQRVAIQLQNVANSVNRYSANDLLACQLPNPIPSLPSLVKPSTW